MNLALLEALDSEDSLPIVLKFLHPLQCGTWCVQHTYVCKGSCTHPLLCCMCSVLDGLPTSSKLRVVGGTARGVFHRLQHLRQHREGSASRGGLDMPADSCEEEDDAAKPCTTREDLEYMGDMLGFWRAVSGVFLHAWVEAGGTVNNELLTLQSACISG